MKTEGNGSLNQLQVFYVFSPGHNDVCEDMASCGRQYLQIYWNFIGVNNLEAK